MENTATSEHQLALPDTALARGALAHLRAGADPSIVNHSIRTYLFGRFVGSVRGLDGGYDDEVLFVAAVLHDIGLDAGPHSGQRFEVDGADRAAEYLRAAGMDDERVGVVWDAIALHTSLGIVERKRPEIALVSAGAGVDLGYDLGAGLDPAAVTPPDGWAARVHAAYPRLDAAMTLHDAIVDQARARPEKAPPCTLPGELVRQVTGAVPPTWRELVDDHRARAESS